MAKDSSAEEVLHLQQRLHHLEQVLATVKHSEERYGHAFHATGEGLFDWEYPDGAIYFSPRFRVMLGLPEIPTNPLHAGGQVPGNLDVVTWMELMHPEYRERFEKSINQLVSGKVSELRLACQIKHVDGEYLWMLYRARAHRTEGSNAVRIIGLQSDITQQTEMETQLREMSTLDALTGVNNRRFFDEHLADEWRRLGRTKDKVTVILLDIDHFKQYNDTYGHQAGDAVLKDVGGALKKALWRGGDFLARYGGEEFVLILPETETDGALEVAERLMENVKALRIPHKASKTDDFLTISLGMASEVPQKNIEPQSLVERADKALYQAKQNGRNRVEVL